MFPIYTYVYLCSIDKMIKQIGQDVKFGESGQRVYGKSVCFVTFETKIMSE